MPKVTICFTISAILLLVATVAKSQNPHFAAVQDMNIWYNPALKTDKTPLARISFRNVSYPNIISYTSKAITFELPFVGRDKTDDNNIPFVNVAAGISTDNSGDQFMVASAASLALSYALPMSDDNTYLAIGFGGNYSFNRLGNDFINGFPPQFDKQGALHWAMTIDPYQSGYNYGYLTAGVGAALFHSEDRRQWYIGGAVRHFNHPYTEWTHSIRLPSAYGVQAGYTAYLSDISDISGYSNFTWQPGNNETVISARYTHYLNDSTTNTVSLGISYRAGDALIPDVALQIGASRLAFCYEMNISNNYHRRAYEFSYRLHL